MKIKKIVIGCLAAAAAATAAFFAYRYFTKTAAVSTPTVYVNKISTILAQTSGAETKFAGVVEPQETWDVKLQEGKTVKEVLVSAGSEVQAGTPLFTYDTDQAVSDLAQAQLDLEKLDNDISNYNAQIAELTTERDKASNDAKLQYTTQIQEAQMNAKKADYDKKSKSAQIDKLQNTINNATVTSQIAGVVKTVGSTSSNAGNTDTSAAFISILTTGEYRIKGSVNEQNVSSVTEGTKVIIRSRVDSAKTWTGTMGKVDTQAATNANANASMYGGTTTDSSTTSTNYPFYVSVDSADGLMLGQHVYIEIDNGQGEMKTGLWLPDYFLSDTDTAPYVWADDGSGRLVKKSVTLGQHDEALMTYEITGGLTEEDAITFPEEGLTEGMTDGIGSSGEMGLAADSTADSTMTDESAADSVMTESSVMNGTADGTGTDSMMTEGNMTDGTTAAGTAADSSIQTGTADNAAAGTAAAG